MYLSPLEYVPITLSFKGIFILSLFFVTSSAYMLIKPSLSISGAPGRVLFANASDTRQTGESVIKTDWS